MLQFSNHCHPEPFGMGTGLLLTLCLCWDIPARADGPMSDPVWIWISSVLLKSLLLGKKTSMFFQELLASGKVVLPIKNLQGDSLPGNPSNHPWNALLTSLTSSTSQNLPSFPTDRSFPTQPIPQLVLNNFHGLEFKVVPA